MMAVELKRVQRSPEEQTEHRQEAEDLRSHQVAEMRAEAIRLIHRFGKGARLWEERGWQFEWPADGTEPEDWPPVMKLVWLLTQVNYLVSEIGMGFTDSPSWCEACAEGEEFPGSPYVVSPCVRHAQIEAMAGHLARALFEEAL